MNKIIAFLLVIALALVACTLSGCGIVDAAIDESKAEANLANAQTRAADASAAASYAAANAANAQATSTNAVSAILVLGALVVVVVAGAIAFGIIRVGGALATVALTQLAQPRWQEIPELQPRWSELPYLQGMPARQLVLVPQQGRVRRLPDQSTEPEPWKLPWGIEEMFEKGDVYGAVGQCLEIVRYDGESLAQVYSGARKFATDIGKRDAFDRCWGLCYTMASQAFPAVFGN